MVVTVKCKHHFLMATTALWFILRLCPLELGGESLIRPDLLNLLLLEPGGSKFSKIRSRE